METILSKNLLLCFVLIGTICAASISSDVSSVTSGTTITDTTTPASISVTNGQTPPTSLESSTLFSTDSSNYPEIVDVSSLLLANTSVTPIDISFFSNKKSPSCSCSAGHCQCCTHQLIQNFFNKIDFNGCVNLKYNSRDSLDLNISVNDKVLLRRAVTSRDPHPVCVSFGFSTCVKLSDVHFDGMNINMCVGMEGTLLGRRAFEVKFDCFKIGAA